MNVDLLEEVVGEITFFKPYIRQFRKYLSSDAKVLVLNDEHDWINKQMNNMGINYECIDSSCFSNREGIYDAVIDFTNFKELYKEEIDDYYQMLDKLLVEDGIVMSLVDNRKIPDSVIDYYIKDSYTILDKYTIDNNLEMMVYKKILY